LISLDNKITHLLRLHDD